MNFCTCTQLFTVTVLFSRFYAHTHTHTHSVIAGVGELDVNRECSFSPVSPPPQDPSPCPYLLLDVRHNDDYEQCHIITGETVH